MSCCWKSVSAAAATSTNVVDKPLATVITPVAMDHMEMLGDTLGKIAAEKAGIIKRGVPLISAMQQAEAEAVIEQRAKELRAPPHIGGQHWQVSVERGRLVFQDERGLLDLPRAASVRTASVRQRRARDCHAARDRQPEDSGRRL